MSKYYQVKDWLCEQFKSIDPKRLQSAIKHLFYLNKRFAVGRIRTYARRAELISSQSP